MNKSKTKEKILIRKAKSSDEKSILELINALADYEKLARPDKEAQKRLVNDIFGPKPRLNVHLVELENKAIAYSIHYFTYSTFLAKPTLYIEDIFVLPEYRSNGVGKELLKHCAKIALKEGCGRMEWQVLDWNKPAIDFYERIGARHMKEWYLYRLNESQLEDLVNK